MRQCGLFPQRITFEKKILTKPDKPCGYKQKFTDLSTHAQNKHFLQKNYLCVKPRVHQKKFYYSDRTKNVSSIAILENENILISILMRQKDKIGLSHKIGPRKSDRILCNLCPSDCSIFMRGKILKLKRQNENNSSILLGGHEA